MRVPIEKMQIYQPHGQLVSARWNDFDRRPLDGRLKNDQNIDAILRRTPVSDVLVLGGGRCREFSLGDVARRASHVTLTDIREEALRDAYKKVDRALRARVRLVQADLSLVDSQRFDQEARGTIQRYIHPEGAVSGLLRFLDSVELSRDPLQWHNGNLDLVLLVSSVMPMVEDFILSLGVAVQSTWRYANLGNLLPSSSRIINGIEKRWVRSYMAALRAHMRTGSLAYFETFHRGQGNVVFPEEYYTECFGQHFRVHDGVLPFKVPAQTTDGRDSNLGFLLEAA